MFLCIDLFIDSFISGKMFIFMFICSFMKSLIKIWLLWNELNQPIYMGFAILDLSKTLMYVFHYSYIKRKYPDSTLLFTDTDSLTYQIQKDNLYEDFYADKHLFDFPGCEKESPFYDDEN